MENHVYIVIFVVVCHNENITSRSFGEDKMVSELAVIIIACVITFVSIMYTMITWSFNFANLKPYTCLDCYKGFSYKFQANRHHCSALQNKPSVRKE